MVTPEPKRPAPVLYHGTLVELNLRQNDVGGLEYEFVRDDSLYISRFHVKDSDWIVEVQKELARAGYDGLVNARTFFVSEVDSKTRQLGGTPTLRTLVLSGVEGTPIVLKKKD